MESHQRGCDKSDCGLSYLYSFLQTQTLKAITFIRWVGKKACRLVCKINTQMYRRTAKAIIHPSQQFL